MWFHCQDIKYLKHYNVVMFEIIKEVHAGAVLGIKFFSHPSAKSNKAGMFWQRLNKEGYGVGLSYY